MTLCEQSIQVSLISYLNKVIESFVKMGDLEIKLERGDKRSLTMSKCSMISKVTTDKVLNRRGVLTILRGIWSVEVAPYINEVGE